MKNTDDFRVRREIDIAYSIATKMIDDGVEDIDAIFDTVIENMISRSRKLQSESSSE